MRFAAWLRHHDPLTAHNRIWAVMFLVVIPFSLAVIVLSARLTDAVGTEKRLHRALVAQTREQAVHRHVLSELCKTNEIITGLVKGTEQLFMYEVGILPPPVPGSIRDQSHGKLLGKPLVDPKLVPYYLNALRVFIGWEAELDHQTACERIRRP